MDDSIKQKFITKIILILILAAITLSFYGCDLNNIESLLSSNSNLSQEEKDHYAYTNTWSNNRFDYDSDSIFANFRALKGGNLKDNYIFRGASPYLENERSTYVNKLMAKNNIRNVVTLSESDSEVKAFIQNEKISKMYFAENLHNGSLKDICLDLNEINLKDKNTINLIITALKNIIYSDGNIYVHCRIGRDRTGIFCALIECLADFKYDEIANDYIKSFENYSYINKNKHPEIYAMLKNNIDTVLHSITNSDEDLNKANLKECCEKFLKYNGMDYYSISKFEDKICM